MDEYDLPPWDQKPDDNAEERNDYTEELEVRNAYTDPASPFYGLRPDWKPTPDRPIPTLRCTGNTPNGRCKNRALRGSGIVTGRAVCSYHGGQLPVVKEYAEKVVQAARMRLLENADLATDTLLDLLSKGTADNIRLAASKEVLDRIGVKGGIDINVEVTQGEAPSEKLLKRLASMRKDGELEDLGEGATNEVVVEEVQEGSS